MARPRLYVDEDSMSRALVRALRTRGIDVVTALDEARSEAEMVDRVEFLSHWSQDSSTVV